MHYIRLKEILVGILAGILFYLSFSKWNLYLLIFPSLILGVRPNPYRFFSFGFVSLFLSLFWIRISLIDYGGINPFLGYFAVLLLVLFLTIYQFGITYIFWKTTGFNYLLFPFIYTSVEILRSLFPYGGFPWLILGINLVDIPVLRYSINAGTVYMGSLIVIALSLFPLLKRKHKIYTLALLTPLILYGVLKERENPSKTFDLKVAVVQTAIPEEVKLRAELFWKKYPLIVNQVKKAFEKKPDLIILPESSVPFYLSELEDHGKELIEISKKVPILLGIIEVEFTEKVKPYNSVILLKDGEVVKKYRKIILVPFGEYTPQPFKFFSRLIPYLGLQDYSRGKEVKCFKVKNVSIGTPICFEIAYLNLVKKFECGILAVLTNDAWFRDSDGNYQHMKWARVRAIENEKPIVWVNNIGPSAIINQKGEIVKKTEYGKPSLLFYTF